jgi:hypothetical protein
MFRQVIGSFRPLYLPLREAIKKMPQASASLAIQIPFYLPNPLNQKFSLPAVYNPTGNTVRKSQAFGSMLLVGAALTATALSANEHVAAAEAESTEKSTYIHVVLSQWTRYLSLATWIESQKTLRECSFRTATEEIIQNVLQSLEQWEPYLERSHVGPLCTLVELFTAFRKNSRYDAQQDSKSITAVEQKIEHLIYKLDPDPRPINQGGLPCSTYSASYIDSVLQAWTNFQTLEGLMGKQWRQNGSVVWKNQTQAVNYVRECLEEWNNSLEPLHVQQLLSLQQLFETGREEGDENKRLCAHIKQVISRLKSLPENFRVSADAVFIDEVLSRLTYAPQSLASFRTVEEMMELQLQRSGSPVWNDVNETIKYVESWLRKWQTSKLEKSHLEKLNKLRELFQSFRSSDCYRRELHNESLASIEQAFSNLSVE